jgi:hypothetical protein
MGAGGGAAELLGTGLPWWRGTEYCNARGAGANGLETGIKGSGIRFTVTIMFSISLRFTRSFYFRHALIGGVLGFFCMVMVLTMRHAGALVMLLPVVFLGPWAFLVRREYRLSARVVNEEGVTRRDGRRFLWRDLHAVQEPLNHVDLIFAGGRVRILFMVLENGMEAIQFARRKAAERIADLRRTIYDLISRRPRGESFPSRPAQGYI